MKWILKTAWLFMLPLTGKTQSVSLAEIRSLYKDAATQQEACNQLISRLNNKTDLPEPVYLGYKGGATMIQAKYSFNPIRKLSYFTNGKNMLEKGIGMDPSNAELRFLRFTIQNNAPSFLGYKSDIHSDKNFLLAALPGMKDLVLKQLIENYFSAHIK
jgi:hypothetical protein